MKTAMRRMLERKIFHMGTLRISMYTKERMLVELLRKKNKLPFDYYKEILGNYRKIIYELDVSAARR